ncbi:2-hydroxy-6-oxo-6-phenylhexa-2,4-dienoate hydrolase [Variovorax sp. PBS-H4]|uniref:alpha/beta fold hydrolase n=1 Tax=Variovorax sp. PBS-H4 TaxID=434008 RepID=UPI001318ACD7|nr:alpha/beta hydrolase [Variovorax sp. PBS-H4]VTU37628.1 2-hydroxy-6-oxo-6-phenylhexa-2,4-dienoate hydrolase [Variovorax sp. PBS-H4]
MLMRFANVDGVPTRYMEAGPADAPVLLLVHGLTLTCDIWMEIADRLGADYRVLAPDMLGHGFTRPSVPAEEVDVGAKAAHLARFVEVVANVPTMDVCGASYGALVACNMYLRRPASVRRLVLHGSGSCFNDEAQLRKAVDRAHATYAGLLSASAPAGWRHHLAGSVFDGDTIPPALPHVLALTYAQPWIHAYWHATIAAMSDPVKFRPYRVLERLEDIRAQTLLVWGLDDPGAPVAAARAALTRMQKAHLATLERCGHFPMFEHPAQTAELMHAFLSNPPRDSDARIDSPL